MSFLQNAIYRANVLAIGKRGTHSQNHNKAIKELKSSIFINLILFLGLILSSTSISRAQSTPNISLRQITGPQFILDSNTPCSGPKSAFYGLEFTNNGGTSIDQIGLNLDSIKFSIPDSTVHLISPADSFIFLGRLRPGEKRNAYFFISYPCIHNESVFLQFTLTSSAGSMVIKDTMITRSSISANAGGLVIEQKPAGTVLGGLATDTVTYEFGNTQAGDEFEFQPAGNHSFKANNLRLLSAKIISSDLPFIRPGATDSFYFVSNASKGGSGNRVKVVYYFINNLDKVSTTLLPYSFQTSGNTNLKHTGNYETGAAVLSFSAANASNTITISKSVDSVLSSSCDTAIVSLVLRNTTNENIMVTKIIDSLPSGFKYLELTSASELVDTMLISQPALGDSLGLEFTGGAETSLFPYLSVVLPANDSLLLQYKVLTSCSSDTSLKYLKSKAYLSATTYVEDSAYICVGCTNLPSMVALVSSPVNASICSGDTNTFKVGYTGIPDSVVWQAFNGSTWITISVQNDSTIDVIAADSMDGHQFRAILYGSGNSDTSASATLTVFKTTFITAEPTDSTICAGTDAAFSLNAEGNSLSYQWQVFASSSWVNVSGAPYSGTTSASLQITNADTSLNATQFRCIVNGSCGADTSVVAVLYVTASAFIVSQPSMPASNCEGDMIPLAIVCQGGGLSYQWQRNTGLGWVNITGANSSTYTIDSVTKADNGDSFRCVITGGLCNSGMTSNILTIQIRGERPKVELNSITSPTGGQPNGSIDVEVSNTCSTCRQCTWTNKPGIQNPEGSDFDLSNATPGDYYLMIVTKQFCVYYFGPFELK